MRVYGSSIIAATLGLAFSPVADAAGPVAHPARFGDRIVLFRSIDGAELGMTPSQVRATLGRPADTQRQGGRISGYGYDATSLHIKGVALTQNTLSVYFDTRTKRDQADAVYGSSASFHTPSGIHVGTPVAQLKRRFGKRLYADGPGNYSMWKGPQGAIGTAETNFLLVDGKVREVELLKTFKEES